MAQKFEGRDMGGDSQAKSIRGRLIQRKAASALNTGHQLLSSKCTLPSRSLLHFSILISLGVSAFLWLGHRLDCQGFLGTLSKGCIHKLKLHTPVFQPHKAGGVPDPKPFIIPREVERNHSNPFKRKLTSEQKSVMRNPFHKQPIPVVQFYARAGSLPCRPSHYIYRNLQQARKYNELVYFIGPTECTGIASELDIIVEPYSEYQSVIDWFEEHLGNPIGYQVRWFVLRIFMERHLYARIFYTDSDVMLFSNITEMASLLFPSSHLALPVRWPSLKPPLSPSQYISTSVSGHVSLWSYEALVDFLKFFVIFIQQATLFGKSGDKSLVTKRAYNDMVLLGWYTFSECWLKDPRSMHHQCIADKASGVTPERSARLRSHFRPKFVPESLCAPRWCNATSWMDQGWCAFDNNFSVQSVMQFFHYRPEDGMKCPTSMHYTHFGDWQNGQGQLSPVQFMGVHFQAYKKGYLSRGDPPSTSWGASPD